MLRIVDTGATGQGALMGGLDETNGGRGTLAEGVLWTRCTQDLPQEDTVTAWDACEEKPLTMPAGWAGTSANLEPCAKEFVSEVPK